MAVLLYEFFLVAIKTFKNQDIIVASLVWVYLWMHGEG